MKKALPTKSKTHEAVIHEIRDVILETAKDKIAFVILFGSFARGDWVYDYYTEGGVDYEFASDYDFLLLTKKNKNGSGHAATKLKNDIHKKLKEFRRPYKSHSPTFVIESVDRMNKELEKGQYFFSDIRKEGIVLYDSEEFELNEARELNGQEIKAIAEGHFEQWFSSAGEFLIDAHNAFKRGSLNKASFYLHQTTESFLNCALLVLTGYKPKSHDLEELLSLCASQSNEFLNIFPLASQEQLSCFELLKKAYIDARYSKDYVITKSQLESLFKSVEKLRDIVEKVCQARIYPI